MTDPVAGALCGLLAQHGGILMVGFVMLFCAVGALSWAAERFLIRPAIRRGAPQPVYPGLKRARKILAAIAIAATVLIALPLAGYARYGCGPL